MYEDWWTCVSVSEPAEIVSHSENMSVVIGESVAVFCESRGVHTPSVVWTVDGSPVHTNSTVTISESATGDTVHSTLTIDTAAQLDDGVYSCAASNSAGSDETSFKLTVQGEQNQHENSFEAVCESFSLQYLQL